MNKTFFVSANHSAETVQAIFFFRNTLLCKRHILNEKFQGYVLKKSSSVHIFYYITIISWTFTGPLFLDHNP